MDYTAHEYTCIYVGNIRLFHGIFNNILLEDQNLWPTIMWGFPTYLCESMYYDLICDSMALDKNLKPRCCDSSHLIYIICALKSYNYSEKNSVVY